MKFYLYDEKTKQFVKEQEGYLDPLETKALYAEYWELKNRLAACETVAEVEAITWPEAGK